MLTISTTYGQITTTKIIDKSQNLETIKYDSVNNFLHKNVYQYIGQELYLKGKSENDRKPRDGYVDFYTEYKKNFDNIVYKCCGDTVFKIRSKYSELAGKYFKVVDVIKHPKANEMPSLYGDKYYLKLIEKSSQDTLFYEYYTKSEYNFPFIVVGYFEKLKSIAIGKKFVFSSNRIDTKKTDISTGNPIVSKLGETWECVDVTIDEKEFDLSLVLKDGIGQKMIYDYKITTDPETWVGIYTLNHAIKYKNQFGLDIWNTILLGKVKIGMTKEMCKLSWGEPQKINETITSKSKSEQWVYSDNYLYFANNKVIAIQ